MVGRSFISQSSFTARPLDLSVRPCYAVILTTKPKLMKLTSERNLNLPPNSHLQTLSGFGAASPRPFARRVMPFADDATVTDPASVSDPASVNYDPTSSYYDPSLDYSNTDTTGTVMQSQNPAPDTGSVSSSFWNTLDTSLQSVLNTAIKTGASVATAALTPSQQSSLNQAYLQGKLPGFTMNAAGQLVPVAKPSSDLTPLLVLGGLALVVLIVSRK